MSGIPPLTLEQLKFVLAGPASAPPPGVIPNLDNPPNSNKESLALVVVCITLTVLAIAGRAYSRMVIVKRLRVEDCKSCKSCDFGFFACPEEY